MSRLSLNQATIKYADLETAVRVTVDAGIPSIGTWREPVQDYGLSNAARLIREAGLRVSSHCRAGFFTAAPEDLARVRDDNERAIDEAATLGASTLVLVVGGLLPGSRDLVGARHRVEDELARLTPTAAAAGIRLGIEPLHPMYAAERAVVSTLEQALNMAAPFSSDVVGVVIDTFHLWWDPDLEGQIKRAGAAGRIASYQVCDWMTPIASDALLSRGIPGDGHIDFTTFTQMVTDTGYAGDIECEVFRQEIWDDNPAQVAARVRAAYTNLIAPNLPPVGP
ncbi:sugar phosphate isomerase/epimerase family protein [Curtobacterium flaccumfaciens]|uniref:sugar phosphate isomerase/epimerase family protein n=1 Tax=Curtobacterium flaccumfaciens TaxID=2035 RepID=UPI001E4D4A55|nr:sugar phosphate isomerase/epimerase family protein [Curtobacterium allii]MCE0459453.1 sugar phosphate isomerase/epimerase [Curtobacterium allii]